ncbi:helix-turn-helix domain-containing protein [Cryobacterium fucosi]|uniref:Helix-turn-helix domain-containing protein n=1 Tax=Cryobacterium fucosi TaxID=1259157 RepID=A0A4R9BBP5_9MICO|nr:helix-turn-helix domain-containing protein [Cryobacterium fucosi]TFD80367.1 helix-turn-helix domain-containing protein [Cryobacterium fucosi]
MSEIETVSAAVGAFVSQVRREHGLTLDQIARAARSYGASWSASSVSNIERGQASLTLPALLLLALALGDLVGQPLTLSALLGDAEVLTLVSGGQHPVKRSWVDGVLNGVEVTRSPVARADAEEDYEVDEELEDEVLRKMREMREMRGREATRAEVADQVAHLLDQSQMPPEPATRNPTKGDAGSLAEERAAKKLGISIGRLRQLALDLWARSLEEESSRRAGTDSTPQARGRVTRVLVDEIRGSMKEGR